MRGHALVCRGGGQAQRGEGGHGRLLRLRPRTAARCGASSSSRAGAARPRRRLPDGISGAATGLCATRHTAGRPGCRTLLVRRASLVTPALPPGPRQPLALQTIGWWTRPISFLERRARYGKRFTIRLLQTPPFVMLSDPDEIKRALHRAAGGAAPRRGRPDPRAGRRQQLGDPARRGRAPGAAQADAARVPRREDAAPLRPHGGGGRARGRALAARRAGRAAPAPPGADARGDPARGVRPRPGRPPRRAARAAHADPRRSARDPLGMLPFMQQQLGGRGPWARFLRLRDEADALLFELIDERRAEHAERDDVLSMLLAARHEDGSPMSRPGAARRADDAARGRPRDDGLGARLGVRAAGAHAGRRWRAWSDELDARRGRRLPHRHDPGDAAPPPGAAQRRAAAREAADRDRRLGLPARRLPRGERLPRPPRPGDLSRTRTRSGRSASSTSSPAPTPGSRSAAAGGAASARASRCSR